MRMHWYSPPMGWRTSDTWLAIIAIAMLAYSCSGCCKKPPPQHCPDLPQPVEVRVQCLTEEPPKMAPFKIVPPIALCQPDPNGNGPQLVGCFDAANALALEKNVKALQRWAKEAWTRCGKAP